MKNHKRLTTIFCSLALTLLASGAFAHNLWLNPGDVTPQVGDTVDVGVGFGHDYPASRVDGQVKEGMLGEAFAIDPDGQIVQLQQASIANYKLKVEKPGMYLVSVALKPGFFSRAQGGMKRGNKKEVADVVECMSMHMIANAAIVAGGADGQAVVANQQALQLTPLADVGKLKKGDALPVKVLFNGQPLADAVVKATYAGFKPEPSQAAPPKDGAPALSPREAARQKAMHAMAAHFPVDVKTDAQGQASLKLDTAGWWIVMLSHSTPFEDPQTCDKHVYKTVYTLEVR